MCFWAEDNLVPTVGKHEAKSGGRFRGNFSGYLCASTGGVFIIYMAQKTPTQKETAFLRLCSRLLGDRELDVDESFVVGVDFLHKVLKSLSSETDKWWVEEESANSVVLGHCANGRENAQVATLLIRVPKITPRRVCLHWTAQETVKKGHHKLNARIVEDPEEIDRFWGPLRYLLAECYLWQRKVAKGKSLREVFKKTRRVTLRTVYVLMTYR